MSIDDERREVRELLGGIRHEPASTPRERLWRELELPPPAAAPPGFARRVVARAAAERRQAFELPLAPRWARVAAALAVIAGVAGGAGLGLLAGGDEPSPEALAWSDASFAEELVAGLDATLAAADAGSAP
jgi:AcrR family transcriptional regulator